MSTFINGSPSLLLIFFYICTFAMRKKKIECDIIYHCVAGMVRVNADTNAVNSRMGDDGRRKPIDSDAVDGEDSPLQSKRSSRFFSHLRNVFVLLLYTYYLPICYSFSYKKLGFVYDILGYSYKYFLSTHFYGISQHLCIFIFHVSKIFLSILRDYRIYSVLSSVMSSYLCHLNGI